LTAPPMSAFFSSGHAVDVILAVLAIEAIALIVTLRRRPVGTVAAAAAPGIFLLFALRESLTGAGWEWIAFWLVLSFPAHLMDLWLRPP
jgi:hypothetical protein